MMEIPRPRTPDERVFVSCYRFDGIRSFLVNLFLPTVGLVALFAFPLLAYSIHRTVETESLTGDLKERFLFLTIVLASIGPLIAAGFFLLWFALRKKIYETVVFYNDEGLTLRTGSKEIQCKWESIQDLRTKAMGRYQVATVVFPQGKISFDATMVDGQGPRPTVKMTLKGEMMIFPNGTVQPLLIEENELYGIVKKRIHSAE